MGVVDPTRAGADRCERDMIGRVRLIRGGSAFIVREKPFTVQ